jgi:hypothetical protein
MNMDQLKIKVVELSRKLKEKWRFVKFIRLDDAGENVSIKMAGKKINFGNKFNFSCPRKPHRNEKVERKFQTYMDVLDQYWMVLELRKKWDAVSRQNVHHCKIISILLSIFGINFKNSNNVLTTNNKTQETLNN